MFGTLAFIPKIKIKTLGPAKKCSSTKSRIAQLHAILGSRQLPNHKFKAWWDHIHVPGGSHLGKRDIISG